MVVMVCYRYSSCIPLYGTTLVLPTSAVQHHHPQTAEAHRDWCANQQCTTAHCDIVQSPSLCSAYRRLFKQP